jgi:hypothetical protein
MSVPVSTHDSRIFRKFSGLRFSVKFEEKFNNHRMLIIIIGAVIVDEVSSAGFFPWDVLKKDLYP